MTIQSADRRDALIATLVAQNKALTDMYLVLLNHVTGDPPPPLAPIQPPPEEPPEQDVEPATPMRRVKFPTTMLLRVKKWPPRGSLAHLIAEKAAAMIKASGRAGITRTELNTALIPLLNGRRTFSSSITRMLALGELEVVSPAQPNGSGQQMPLSAEGTAAGESRP